MYILSTRKLRFAIHIRNEVIAITICHDLDIFSAKGVEDIDTKKLASVSGEQKFAQKTN